MLVVLRLLLAKLQSLPILVDYTGPARVSTYFVATGADGNALTFDEIQLGASVEAAFRGRILKGEKLRLPEQCHG